MFRRHQGRRSTNIVFVIFRLILSLVMFIALLAGIYAAYKHFSGLDPLKFDPMGVISKLLAAKTPEQFLSTISSIKIGQNIIQSNPITQSQSPKETPQKAIFSFVLVADSHSDNNNLNKALIQAKSRNPAFVIGAGDYTEVGTLRELQEAKKEFDSAGLRYFLIPGDHDLWDSRDKQGVPLANFKTVFGPNFQSFVYENFLFLLLDNSDNYKGIGEEQQTWISDQLERAQKEKVKGIFVIVHEPLFHPSSDHFMGRVESKLKQQAKSLIFEFKAAGVKKVFAGDTHYFSEYKEPETELPMVTVGALTTERNPQAPRYAQVWVFENGSTKVEDIAIK